MVRSLETSLKLETNPARLHSVRHRFVCVCVCICVCVCVCGIKHEHDIEVKHDTEGEYICRTSIACDAFIEQVHHAIHTSKAVQNASKALHTSKAVKHAILTSLACVVCYVSHLRSHLQLSRIYQCLYLY